jgi:hypothetical protein
VSGIDKRGRFKDSMLSSPDEWVHAVRNQGKKGIHFKKDQDNESVSVIIIICIQSL